MSYRDRVELYRNIEALRSRPLIAYVTSSRLNASGQIGSDVVPHFIKQINAVPADSKEVDVLIVSAGGDPITIWHIVSLLRERFTGLSVLLPYTAYSAATLLALGADEIVMHRFSNLGPVDPQLRSRGPRAGESAGSVAHYGSADLSHYLAFVREEVGISDQTELLKSFELLCAEVGALAVGIAKRSTELSKTLGEKLLGLHMDDGDGTRLIVDALNKSYHHHGYPVGRREAKAIGLPVVDASGELADLLWAVWEDVSDEMECERPFSQLELLLEDPEVSQVLDSVRQIQIPANLPAEAAQQVYNRALQQIAVVEVPAVEYELFHAALESMRCRSGCRSRGKLNATRLPDMRIKVYATNFPSGWTFADSATIL